MKKMQEIFDKTPLYYMYVAYMNKYYIRSQEVIDERNKEIVTCYDASKGEKMPVIRVKCASDRISVCGTNQLQSDIDKRMGFALRILITTVVDNCFYGDINLSREDGTFKTDDYWYRFKQSIELNGEDHLEVYIKNADRHICSRNIRLAIDCDMWVH